MSNSVNSAEQVASFMRAQEHVRQTNKVYTQAEMDAALDARVEECAVIAEAEGERFTGFASLGIGGAVGRQTVNSIASAIRATASPTEKKGGTP